MADPERDDFMDGEEDDDLVTIDFLGAARSTDEFLADESRTAMFQQLADQRAELVAIMEDIKTEDHSAEDIAQAVSEIEVEIKILDGRKLELTAQMLEEGLKRRAAPEARM